MKIGDTVKIMVCNDIGSYQHGLDTVIEAITERHIVVSFNNPKSAAHGRKLKFGLDGFGLGRSHNHQLIKSGGDI